jgi:iron complex outermembrane receptor protein
MSKGQRILLFNLALATAVGAHSLAAAESSDTAAPSSVGTPQPALTEIIVIAQKREQNINDVGIAITNFESEAIKTLGFNQLSDIATAVPNMQVNNLVTNVPNFSIRGVGVNDYAINQPSSVGVYVDQVFMFSPALLNSQLFDTNSIEVLKGPQGTLYGRNTTGGAVLYTSNAPTKTFEADTYTEVGNYGYYQVEGAVSGPLSDTVAARFAFSTVQSTGYQKIISTGQTAGGIDRDSVRSIFDWQPIDNLKLRFNVHASTDKSNLNADNTPGVGNNTLSAGTIDIANNNGVPYRNNDGKGASLVADWRVDPVVFTLVSAFEQLRRFEYEDQDGLIAPPARIDAIDQSFLRGISEEFRVASSNTGPITWVAGLYYSRDTISDFTNYVLPAAGYPPGAFGLVVPPIYPVLTTLGNTYFQTTTSRATFGQVEWKATQKWRFTAGVRYTKEDKELDDVTTPYTAVPEAGVVAPVLSGVLFPAASYSRDFSATTWKVGADYHLNNDSLLYANVSKGFKSGGFPGTLVASPSAVFFFDPETVLSYEAGSKITLAQGRVQVNTAVFYYDYKNLQAEGTLRGAAGGNINLFALRNIGDAVNKGIEIDLEAAPTERLRLSLGAGYLDAAITNPFIIEVRTGGEPALSPRWNANARASYTVVQDTHARWFVEPNVSFKGAQYFDIYETPFLLEHAYWLWNGDVGVETTDGKWRATLWGRNLADREYRVGGFSGGTAGNVEQWGAPRTYGVSFSYHYK